MRNNITGDTLKELRLKSGLTLDDVSEYIGVSKSTISKYENGYIAVPAYDVMNKFAQLYHVTPEYIRTGQNDTVANVNIDFNEIVRICDAINQKPVTDRVRYLRMIQSLIDLDEQ